MSRRQESFFKKGEIGMAGILAGKIALVTGGASGIGRASALAFSREGAKVIVVDREVDGGESTATSIRENGSEACFVRADVSRTSDVQEMVKRCVELYGRLECALNNAGVDGMLFTRIAEYREQAWDQVIGINLKGTWLCMKYEIIQMIEQGGGSIVNMASTAGLVGSAVGNSAYVASKHGIVGLTKTVALEYGTQGIRVNAVCPALTKTPMAEKLLGGDAQREAQMATLSPMGRLAEPEEVAEAVVWLCSDSASYVTGQALAVDGGHVAR
jgi:NAD(P)-dependent dehydrogenase (short-subunit alcohol dehydrogenase family)